MKNHQYHTQILERHLDSFGHVNNAQYLILFEEARWEMVTSRGFGIKKVLESNIGTVILACSLKFKRELYVRERITIETELVSVAKKIVILRQSILNELGKVAAEAEFKISCFDLKERKIIHPTEPWLDAISGEWQKYCI